MNRSLIHPTAIVESERIGDGTYVWAFTHILEGALIGANCNVGDHCFIESGAVIGDDVTIKNGNSIWDGVTLEDGVFVAPGVIFTNDRHPRSPRLAEVRARYAGRDWLVPTKVGRGATIGAGAIILAGVSVGEFAFIAAGALVTDDVLPHARIMGQPGRHRGWVCRCAQPLDFVDAHATCLECGLAFRLDGEAIAPLET
jgi:UDP-2-acetamido-3-amino-2,3-dideoxy-glucuronate N-acetyltransferase